MKKYGFQLLFFFFLFVVLFLFLFLLPPHSFYFFPKEILFLLGGCPRATVKVDSETADIVKIDRSQLSTILAKDTRIASGFWKYLACLLYSRLVFLQLRLSDRCPAVPKTVKVEHRPPPPSISPEPAAAAPPALAKETSFGIPVGMDPVAQQKLIEQLKMVLSDEESSEGDE